MKSVLITGANRGLGLEFARQYLADGWHVLAACRNPDAGRELRGLQGSGKLDVLRLDTSRPDSFHDFAEVLADKAPALDLLINNAAIYPSESSFSAFTPEALENAFKVNVVGPLCLTRTLAPLLAKAEGPRVANLSSGMGSIASKVGAGAGGDLPYSISKAALNMATRLMANELGPRGITVVCVSPGWVKTDMGGSGANLTPEQSIASLKSTFAGLKAEDNGRFMDRDGSPIDW